MCAAFSKTVASWLQPPSPSSGLASSCNLILVMPNVLKLDSRLKSDDASFTWLLQSLLLFHCCGWVQWLSSKSILPEPICSLYTTSASSLASPFFPMGVACKSTCLLVQLLISRYTAEAIKNWTVGSPEKFLTTRFSPKSSP